MNLEKVNNVYFIGIGGIGMSALARYFNLSGKKVAGYDLTPSPLTSKLIKEGIEIHFNDNINEIPTYIKDISNTLIVYTPAIPEDNNELNFFLSSGYQILKRSEVLGIITDNYNTIAVAGTHGKTSISGLISHIITESESSCTAFLGGISKSFNSNFIYSELADFAVAEADEFDRSFLNLNPVYAIITSTDADHLDIYKDHNSLKSGFSEFAKKIRPNGILLYKKNIHLNISELRNTSTYTYSTTEKADFNSTNIRFIKGKSYFDIILPDKTEIRDIYISLPGRINIENALAAASMAHLIGLSHNEIREGLASFTGINRRFDFQINTDNLIFMDDYAHHPKEITAMISSVKEMYPDKKITGIFQPHLFSRTRDFADDFAKSLSLLDDVILLDIYPAREKPIPGITSKIILEKIVSENKSICHKDELLDTISKKDIEFLITIGAGDIDRLVPGIKELLEMRIL